MGQAEAEQDENPTEARNEKSESLRWHRGLDIVEKLSEIRRRKKSKSSGLLAAFKRSGPSQGDD
jgi:hypothetical protein